jgi:hypothetical protein
VKTSFVLKEGMYEDTRTRLGAHRNQSGATLQKVKQRSNWKVCAAGYGIHWPDLDEDLGTEGLLRGAPAPVGSKRGLANRSRRRRKARRA